MSIEIQEVEPLHLACLRHVGPYPQIGETFGKLGPWVKQNQLPWNQFVGIYYDDPGTVPGEQLRSDACIIVPPGTAASGEVTTQTIPGGKYAVYTHIGSYAKMGDSWMKAMEEIHAQGLKIGSRPMYELYVDDCADTPEERLRTAIHIPID